MVYPKAFIELCVMAKYRYTYGIQCRNSSIPPSQ